MYDLMAFTYIQRKIKLSVNFATDAATHYLHFGIVSISSSSSSHRTHILDRGHLLFLYFVDSLKLNVIAYSF